ncbi:MAG: DUF342 domain-containing protein [Nitrosomonadales bacterium]|nr:DUF342 domain-containing protein [Nitrosomonadales bacterium]
MVSTFPIGGVADIKEGEILLPVYVTLRSEGVFINISGLPPEDGLKLFVERLFANGSRFEGLDYSCLMRLLYGTGAMAPASMGVAEARVADGIVRFPPQRRALYKGVKIIGGGARAEYLFEPVAIEVAADEPVYGEPGENGARPITGYTRKTSLQPGRLNFDEFVADMWLKGVRFGIDAEPVRQAIASGETTRMDIAFQREPTSGADAEIQEESDALRRDNSPRIMLDGKADLRRFKNRFPQIAKDLPLLRKIPRALGEPGFRVTGQIIEPPLPADLDLQALAGPGTRIERRGSGEVIVANMDGFLAFDTRSNHIAVTEKVEDRGGISIRTTGDLSLAVDDFVEHGEVQEWRVVEGKHMTFLAGVFGTVISDNGDILLKSTLSGGRAQSNGGNITVRGRAYNAGLEARDGNITVPLAESCTIIGKTVSIERAVNCEIVAEELRIGEAEGCAIAGKTVRIASSCARKGKETVITLLAPDFSDYDRQIALIKKSLTETGKAIQAKSEEIRIASSEPEFAKCLAATAAIQSGAIKLTAAQQSGWQQMAARFARASQALAALHAEKTELEENRLASEQEIERISRQRESSATEVLCEIGKICGDTIVRKLHSSPGVSAFHGLPGHELRVRLRNLGAPHERIFSEDEGSVNWHCRAPQQSA